MKKYFLSFLMFLFFISFLRAQKNDLWVQKGDKGFYLIHKVVSKESFYSIGRLYNVPPKSLAAFNNLDMTQGLQIDQKLKIPLTESNYTQEGNSGTPVFYKTGNNEDMMSVGAVNNVAVDKLHRWNQTVTGVLKPGARLIVGFLLSKQMPSVTIKPVEKPKEAVVQVIEKPDPVVVEKKEEIKAEPKNDEPVVVKEEIKSPPSEQGYFKLHFEQQIKKYPLSKEETVTSGIFKTTSGWQDAKYYMLMDGIEPGTVVRVLNPANNKAVYAKVLGQMAGISQNQGLNIRISNVAASALDITDQDKFVLKINY